MSVLTKDGGTAISNIRDGLNNMFNVTDIRPALRHISLGLLCLCSLVLQAQGNRIFLEHANSTNFDKNISPDYHFLIGEVRFRHDNAWLYCDTAHYYRADNSLRAFGNVRIEQGDTLFIYGKTLFYDGNKKLAQIRKEVRMVNKEVTLYTDHLDYDRISNIGYYFNGGKIVDPSNTLTSDYGRYNPDTKMAFFKKDVTLTHPQFLMKTDTLNYNTETGVASIISKTEIEAENADIIAYRGWYNTKTDKSLLLDRSYVVSEQRRLTGDSILYDQSLDIGEAFIDVEMVDSIRNITLTSDYALYNQSNNYALLTKKALLREYSGKDTFYLHADTLLGQQDSIYDTFRAFYNVRSYRTDLQGLCDSAFYSTRDSVLQLFGNPILWADNQQISGQQIRLYTKNQQPDYMKVEGLALLASKEDSSLFNQSSGRELIAYFLENKVRRVVIEGNPESIYLPRDEKQKILGLNRLENGSLNIFMDQEGKMEKLKVSPQPKGKFYPLQLVTEEIKYLEHFNWPIHLRPIDPGDVFRLTDRPRAENMGANSEGGSGSNSDATSKASLRTFKSKNSR
ncbi:MAG: OstA-like protein [Bacteroidales bacterium]|nr:OstA-like protein [Bacteroidales bacterium]MDD3431303.1 OstA-like protein [Bacteroidales bacterium]